MSVPFSVAFNVLTCTPFSIFTLIVLDPALVLATAVMVISVGTAGEFVG